MIERTIVAQGEIAGVTTETGTAFLGIPYAAPPVGPLRWKPPQPAASWSGTFTADSFSGVAHQPLPADNSLYHPGTPPQSEDCLTLNVWTDAADAGEKRPVMVWFHLGAFIFGSSAGTAGPGGGHVFDGARLAARGAVVVTVNYRLGRFGFLAHPWLSAESAHGASGNYGFMDQVAALQWVRDNIAAFGGDAGNVTIVGLSAGSASCSLHMASPLSKGLFHRVIASSGGFLGPRATASSGLFDRLLTLEAAERRGMQVSDALGVTDLAALRALPVEAILSAPIPNEPGPWVMEALGGALGEGAADTMYPIVDGHALPDTPGAIIAAGRHNDVPLLTGSALDDASGLPSINDLSAFRGYVAADMGENGDAALQAYSASDDASAAIASGDLIADRVFGWQNWTWARLAHDHGTAPVYYYEWAQPQPIPEGRYIERRLGAVHGAEMPHLFGTFDAYGWNWTDADRALGDIVARYWINFARDADPNGDGLPSWPQFEGAAGPAMQMRHKPLATPPGRTGRFAVLDRYYA
ncbi:carboxylesterase/lipase family protein [Sphingomonas profundi]|uniref:carboxylesterase/lipase family protein n=1 Tax=Alterirhizorhabdus profundi TaxID=2681549 RepID=UPI0012E884EB|nr:carboxylesterase family protein [Sphingomonas profundi]